MVCVWIRCPLSATSGPREARQPVSPAKTGTASQRGWRLTAIVTCCCWVALQRTKKACRFFVYARVLDLLGPQISLGWILAFANVCSPPRNSPSLSCLVALSTLSLMHKAVGRGSPGRISCRWSRPGSASGYS